ncbi:MAG: hypothetical protein LBP87_00735 [Planctomycetaceae bacterium]|jgi:hypothetical protein|nr:hypothetical protein [Planctomycetaceae bacterium]
MFRLFCLFFSVVFLLNCSGCKDKTIPATTESSQPETESQPVPPLLADPFQPHSAVNVKELAKNETKTEPIIPVTPEPAKSETAKPEQIKSETVKSETISSETVQSETPLPPASPANDLFIQAATNQNSVTTPTDFGFGTPNTTDPELSLNKTKLNETNVTISAKPLEEVKPTEPTEETKPTESIQSTEKIADVPIIPKELESVTTPFVSESLAASVPATTSKTDSETNSETEPFVLNSVPVAPSPVNPLRQEIKTPPTENVAKNQIELPTENVAKNQTELSTENVAKNKTELSTENVAKNQSELPTENVAKNKSELPTENVAKNKTELSTENVAKNQSELPTENVAKNQSELPTENVAKTTAELSESNIVSSDVKQTFDAVAVNGELFVGWEKPKLLLVFTGFMNGYVEPCGCAGLEQMKGGLSRRHTFFKELEEKKGWSILPIDAGNLNKGFGRQEELKFNFVIDEALRLMKYQATGVGNRELLLPTDALILYFVDVPEIPRRYTSANVAIMEFDPDFTAPYRVFEQNGVKVGVTSVIGQSLLKEINNDDIKHEDAVKRLKEMLPKFAAEKCNKRVLIIHGSAEETKRIVKSVTGQFDYVIPSNTPAEPPFQPNWIDNSMLIEVGEKGKFAVAIGLYDDLTTPFRYQRIPLDSRFKNSKTITDLMQLYQEQLKETGLQGLGIKPIPNRRTVESGRFTGTKSCADCHELSFSAWRKSRHALAWRSLAETSKPSRTFDPECIACHVVGWNSSEFLPYEHGFLGETETPELLNVGCEVCHGPGENHIKAEQGSDTIFQEKQRKIIRLPLDAAKRVCIQCHDGDNSPHFDFETYWKKIVHKE